LWCTLKIYVMETIIKAKDVKAALKAAKEAKESKEQRGKSSNGLNWMKTLGRIIIL